MTDLKPLRESSTDDFAREVLQSAFLDEPPRHALRRTALWLGVGEAAATTLATSSALGAAPALTGALATKASGSLAALAVLKWLGAGALVGAVTAGGIEYTTHAAAPAAPRDAVAAPATRPAQAVPAVVTPAAAVPDEPATPKPLASTADRARAAAPPRARTPSATEASRESADPRVPRVPRAPALELEIGQIDRARAALARGSPEAALAELDAYERRRKTLVLDREAMVLRIDALLGKGEREAAAALARAYVAAHPNDPHARRLRALVR
jgi:hypothetical protein